MTKNIDKQKCFSLSIQRGELPKKRGTWTVCRFKGGLGKKERGGGVFYPNAHYDKFGNRQTSLINPVRDCMI